MLIFPAAYMSITYAITALMIACGLLGEAELAAELAVSQGATIATFYAFSANTRNLILSQSEEVSPGDILLARLLLVIPLAIAAYFLSTLAAGVSTQVALVVVLRRSVEWMNEVHLSRREVQRDRRAAIAFLVIQIVLFLGAVAAVVATPRLASIALYTWALLPLLVTAPYLAKEALPPISRFIQTLPRLSSHFGSTAMLGLSIYAFRLLIVLLLPKATAGDLFTAIGIGSFMGSLFANVLGPTIALSGDRNARIRLPRVLRWCMWATASLGAGLLVGSLVEWRWFAFLGKSFFFWSAAGASLVGGVVMVLAQRIRLELLRDRPGTDVFGPDVLMNILLVTAVPVAHALAGQTGMILLYPLNALLAYMFYRSSQREGAAFQSAGVRRSAQYWGRLLIASGLIFPLFFLLSGKIYNATELMIDSGGVLANLPLPVSVVACFLGILIVGQYRKATVALAVIFLMFVLMLAASLYTTSGELASERGKLLLMLQFLLPSFALVLGLTFESSYEGQSTVERASIYVLAFVVPVQLAISWASGTLALQQSLRLFTVYQHAQYVPVMFAGSYLVALSTLWATASARVPLALLGIALGVYTAASNSMLSIALLATGMLALGGYGMLRERDWRLLALAVVTVVAAGGYFLIARNTIDSSLKYGFLYGTNRPYYVESMAPIATYKAGTWTLRGQPSDPREHLIRYVIRTVGQGHVFVAEGTLRTGALRIGVAVDGEFVEHVDLTRLGDFSVALRPGTGRLTAVVASRVPEGGVIDARLTRLGWEIDLGTKLDRSAERGLDGQDTRVSPADSRIPMNLLERIYDWRFYATRIVESRETMLFGHPRPPDRSVLTSAHNYYLDFLYNFGLIALLPLVGLIGYTCVLLWQRRHAVMASGSLLGLSAVVVFLIFVDNNLKVTMRQPYPGILTFFLWGLLLSRLRQLDKPATGKPPERRLSP